MRLCDIDQPLVYTLVTANVREFSRVKALAWKDWARG